MSVKKDLLTGPFHKNGPPGFTLIEVMAALGITAVMMGAAMSLAIGLTSSNQSAFQDADLYSVVNTINMSVTNSLTCKNSLAGQNVSLVNFTTPIQFRKPYADSTVSPTIPSSIFIDGNTTSLANPAVFGQIHVSSLNITLPKLLAGSGGQFYTQLQLQAERVTSSLNPNGALGGPFALKTFDLIVQGALTSSVPGGTVDTLSISDCWAPSATTNNRVCPNQSEIVTGVNADGSVICQAPNLSQLNNSCPYGTFVSGLNLNDPNNPSIVCSALSFSCGAGQCMTGVQNSVPQCQNFSGLSGIVLTITPTPTPVPPSPTQSPSGGAQ